MLSGILTNIIIRIIFGKGGIDMVAMLWVTRIVHGKKTYDDVPRGLKNQVKELLIEGGLEEFITGEEE